MGDHSSPRWGMTSLDPVVWLHAYRQRGPRGHGTALHEHHCSDDEFDQLRALLRRPPRSRAAWMCFGLYASEWLRRHFDGGEWTYKGMFAALGWPTELVLDYDELEEALEVGWGVDLLRSAGGREFFATLLLQAMPLRALVSQRGALAEHMPRLLRAAAEGASHAQLVALAAASAGTLPVAWREPAALTLLAGVALHLRHTDLAQLELANPSLRAALERATERPQPTLQVRRSIVEVGDHFEWRVDLECPESIHEAELLRALGLSAPPSGEHWELFVQNREGSRVHVGRATRDPSREHYHVITREPCEIEPLGTPLDLVALLGEQTIGPRPLRDREPLEGLPWVFVRSGDPSQDAWHFAGQGELATRENVVLVTLPPDARFDHRVIPRRIGMLGNRPIFECTTSVIVQFGSSRCEIRVGAERDVRVEYELEGERLEDPVVGRPVFLGMPTLVEHQEGRQRRIAASSLRWRPRGTTSWRSDLDVARGAIEVCCVQRGVLLWQAGVRVVPRGLGVDATLVDERHAELRVSGLEPGVEVTLDTSHDASSRGPGLWRLAFADASRRVDVTLRWSEREALRFTCRLPRSALAFELGHEALPDEAELGLDELYLVRAVAAGTRQGRARLTITAKVGAAKVEVTMPLSERGDLDLLRVRDRLRMTLAANLCIEAKVRVALDDGVTQRAIHVRRWSRRLHCSDGQVTLSSRAGQLRGAELDELVVEARSFVDPNARETLARVEDGYALAATSLPDDTLLVVARRRGRVWACPRACSRRLAAGALELDAQPCSADIGLTTRPARQRSTELPAAPVVGLAAALELRDKAQRCAALDRALALLVEDHRHPDWKILDAYVATLGDIHASTFDVFERVLQQPAVAAGLLLRAHRADFDRIWDALEELPFSWNLVAIRDWTRAARAMLHAWQEEGGGAPLESLAAHVERLRELASHRSRAAPLVFSCILAALFERREGARSLELVERIAATLHDDREHAMQTLLRTTADWPCAPGLSRLLAWIETQPSDRFELVLRPPPGCGFRGPLLAGPAIAALFVADPSVLAPHLADREVDVVQLLTELRLLEAGYCDWYRECFVLTLQLAAARRRQILCQPSAR